MWSLSFAIINKDEKQSPSESVISVMVSIAEKVNNQKTFLPKVSPSLNENSFLNHSIYMLIKFILRPLTTQTLALFMNVLIEMCSRLISVFNHRMEPVFPLSKSSSKTFPCLKLPPKVSFEK